MTTKKSPNKSTQAKMRSIIVDLVGQIFMLNTCTKYHADITYDGDDCTIQITVYNEKFDMIFDTIEKWTLNDRVKRLAFYRNMQNIRIRLLDIYNKAACQTE